MKAMRLFVALLMLASVVSSAYAGSIDIINLGEGNYTLYGDMIHVLTSGDSSTIQKSISIIPSGGVIVLSGDFEIKDTLQINNNVTITSSGNSRLYGDGTKGLADLNANITLENLTFENGGGELLAGAMYITGSGNIVMNNCVIRNCSAGYCGGGIYVSSSYTGTLTMTNCEIRDNTVSGYETQGLGWGGGICVYGGTLLLHNCKIQNNYAYYYGGGLYGESPAYAGADENCIISGNSSVYYQDYSDICWIGSSSSASSSSLDTIGTPEANSSSGGCNTHGIGVLLLAFILTERRFIS